MEIHAKSIIGLKIISLNDGKEIETVEDVVYDPSAQRITALLVNSGGLFSRPHAIAIEDVRSIGSDAVIVASADVIKKVSDLPEGVEKITSNAFNLVKTTIITQDGTELGKVSDLVFDATAGNVLELVITQGGISNMTSGKKRVKPTDIITVGADATIVSNYIEEAFEEPEQQGGLKGALNSVKDTAGDVKDTVVDKTQQAVDKVKELPENPTVKDTVQSAKETTSTLTDKTKAVGASAIRTVQEKAGDAKDKVAERTTESPQQQTVASTPSPTPLDSGSPVSQPPVGQEVQAPLVSEVYTPGQFSKPTTPEQQQ